MGLNQRTDDRADDGQGTGERPVPRHGRAALLRLAGWFEEAGTDRADDLARAAYALHPALHVEGRVDESIAATTAWWQAEADRSAVVEHPGTRPPAPVRDHRAQQARLRDAAESSAHWRRAGASQIRALLTEPTGDRAHVDLSGAGMEVLMELLTAALGAGDAARSSTSAGDLEFSLRLHVVSTPGAEVTVQGEGGDLTLEGVRLCVTPYEQHVLDLPESEEPGDGAMFGLGRPRGAATPDAPHPAQTTGTPEASQATQAAGDTQTTHSTDATEAAQATGGAEPEPEPEPAADAPAPATGDGSVGSHADVLAGPGEDHLLGPARDESSEAAGAGGGFAELAGAVAEALALARAEEEPGAGSPDALGDRSEDRFATGPGAESSESPVEDPATTDSLAEQDRDRRLDPNTETTGPIDLSAIRDGERSAWG